MRQIEAVRDRIMCRVGTDEALIPLPADELYLVRVSRQWRRPLSIEEVARLAPTPEVVARPGRA
jgi:hypothetical protein